MYALVRLSVRNRHNDMNGDKKGDWLPYAIAAGLVAAISIDIWLLSIWFGV
jgi:hypothetical protein